MDSSLNISWTTDEVFNDSDVRSSCLEGSGEQVTNSIEPLRQQISDAMNNQAQFRSDIVKMSEEMNAIRKENAQLVKTVEKIWKSLQLLSKNVTKLEGKNVVSKKRRNAAVDESKFIFMEL